MPDVVVVTGASAGLGRAIVREFAKKRVHIGLISRDRDRLEAAKKEVEDAGGRALVTPCDVADATQVFTAAEQIEKEFGPIDIWVNNAMATIFAEFVDISPEEFRRSTEVTYLGSVYGAMAALRSMWQRNQGTIIQMGSALAYRSIPLQAPYCGAKHAIMGFLESLRCEIIHRNKNIHVGMVQLPAMNTPQFSWCRTKLPRHPMPVPPIYEPEVAARAVVWAAYHRRRQVYVGLPTVKAIWGEKFIPGLLDKYLGDMGYDAQQTQEPVDPNRPDNLFHTVPGDYAAHGIFTQQSSDYSLETWGSLNKRWLSAAGALAAGFALAAFVAKR